MIQSIKDYFEDLINMSTPDDWVRRVLLVLLVAGGCFGLVTCWNAVDIGYKVVDVDTGECIDIPSGNFWCCLNCGDPDDNRFVSDYVFQNRSTGELRKYSKNSHLVTTRVTKRGRCQQ